MNTFALIALRILIGILVTLFAIVIYIVGYLSYHHHQDMKIAREIMNPALNRERSATGLYLRAPSLPADK
jgi:hypothetical protein